MRAKVSLFLAIVSIASLAPGAAKTGVSNTDRRLQVGKDVELWRRVPHLAVPDLATPPKIDGVVDAREWSKGATIGPMTGGLSGVADEYKRKVVLGRDNKNFYVAVQLERPVNALKPSMPNDGGRVDSTRHGDFVEVMFAPDLNFDKGFSFWVYANGAYGDARTKRSKDRTYNPEWERAARLTDSGWELEIAIPWEALGNDESPKPNAVWGFDICDNRRTPFRRASHWSFRGGKWHVFENYGRISFPENAPSIRFEQAGSAGAKKAGVRFGLLNDTAKEVRVKAKLALMKRRAGADGGPKSYYPDIDSAVSHDAQADYSKSTSLKHQIINSTNFYSPIAGAAVDRTVTIPAGERRDIGMLRDASIGEYLLSYQFLDGDAILHSGIKVFEIKPPLSMKLEPYWLYSQMLDVIVDLSKVSSPEGSKVQLFITGKDGEETHISETTVSVPAGAASLKGALSTAKLVPGYYRVHAVLRSDDGKELARNVADVERPKNPSWFRNDLGNRVEVPRPWTPIVLRKVDCGLDKAEPVELAVWGRTYKLDKMFPTRVLSQDAEILAKPISLDMIVDGKALEWKLTKMSLISSTSGKAVYEGVLENDIAVLSGTITAEFDGFIWYDLKLKPKGIPLVDAIKLDIPIVSERCELMTHHRWLVDKALSNKTPKPALNGAPGAFNRAKMPFSPYLWVGNEAGGMGFIAEAPIDWKISDPSTVLETLPSSEDQKYGILRANIVQEAATIDKPMRLQFGMQATPIRPMPAYRKANLLQRMNVFENEALFKMLSESNGAGVVFYHGWRGDSKTELGGTPERPKDAEQREKLKRAVETVHKNNLKVIMYTGWGINATSDNWKKFSYELAKYPIENKGWGAYHQSAGLNGGYADFMAWGHADLAKEYGVDGVLYDSSANIHQDMNLRIGNAWVDDQGRTRPLFPVRAMRELQRRIYTIYTEEVRKDGIIYNHAGSFWPLQIFGHILNRGEGRPQHALTLRKSWLGMEEFRAGYSGIPFGILFSGDDNNFKRLPMRVNNHMAVWLLNGSYVKINKLRRNEINYAPKGRPIIPMWKAFDWLGMDSATKHYYFDKTRVVALQPESLYSSVFVSKDKKRALVVVSNLDKGRIPKASIALDLKALGIDPKAKLVLEDVVLEKSIPINKGRFQVEIPSERYRFLKLYTE
jgi:Glycoside hydrolase 123, N-terminal domain